MSARPSRADRPHRCCRLRVTLHRDDLEPRHHRAGGIRPVRGSGNQTDIAMLLAPAGMVLANDEQPGVFALRTGVRLQRNGGKPGDFRQPTLRVAGTTSDNPASARSGANGCSLPNSGHVTGIHLGRRVQLHRAGAQRNHRGRERQIARFEPLHVAQHLGLGVVRLKTGCVRYAVVRANALVVRRIESGRVLERRRSPHAVAKIV